MYVYIHVNSTWLVDDLWTRRGALMNCRWCMHVTVYAHIYVRTYICYIYMYVRIYIHAWTHHVDMYMYVHIYVICISVYIYTHMDTSCCVVVSSMTKRRRNIYKSSMTYVYWYAYTFVHTHTHVHICTPIHMNRRLFVNDELNVNIYYAHLCIYICTYSYILCVRVGVRILY